MSVCRVLLCVSLMLLYSVSTQADTLWLKNGDRLTGQIELLEGGKLHILTELAGRVTVSVQNISTFETDNAQFIKVEGQADRALSVEASEVAGEVLLRNGAPQAVPLSISSIEQMLRPRPLVEDWVWEGKATAALDIKNNGTEQRDLDLAFTTQARHGDWRHQLGGEFERDYRDDIKSRHVWNADYDLSWFFDEHWFWQTSLGYQRDHLNDIARRKQVGMGPGYEWWNNALGRFETSTLLDYVELENRDGSTDHFNALAVEWDFRRYLFGKRFELFHGAETLVPDDPAVDYVIDAELGVRYLLNNWA